MQALARNHRALNGSEAEIRGPPHGSGMRNFVAGLLAVARVTLATVLDVLEARPGAAAA